MGLTNAADDNQFVSIYTSVIGRIQNITQQQDRKADGCDAESARARAVFSDLSEIARWHGRCSFTRCFSGQVIKKEIRTCCGQF